MVSEFFLNRVVGNIDWVVFIVFLVMIDVVLVFLLWKFLWGLEMSIKEKVGVMIVMSMGVLWVFFCLWRKGMIDNYYSVGVVVGIKFVIFFVVYNGIDLSNYLYLLFKVFIIDW